MKTVNQKQSSVFNMASYLDVSLRDVDIKSLRPKFVKLAARYETPNDWMVEVAWQPRETAIQVSRHLAGDMVAWIIRAQEVTAVLQGSAGFEGDLSVLIQTLKKLDVLREKGKHTGDLILVPPGGREARLVQALEFLVRDSSKKMQLLADEQIPYPWRVAMMPSDDDGNPRDMTLEDLKVFVTMTRDLADSIHHLESAHAQIEVVGVNAPHPGKGYGPPTRITQLKGLGAGPINKFRLTVTNGVLLVQHATPEVRECEAPTHEAWDAGEVFQAMERPERKVDRVSGRVYHMPGLLDWEGDLPPVTQARDLHLANFLRRARRGVLDTTHWVVAARTWLDTMCSDTKRLAATNKEATSKAILSTMASIPRRLMDAFNEAFAKYDCGEQLSAEEIKLLRAYPARHLLLSVLTTTQVEADALLASKSLVEQMKGQDSAPEEEVQAVEPEPVNTLAQAEDITDEDQEVFASDPEPVTTPEVDPSEGTTEEVETPQEAPAEAVA